MIFQGIDDCRDIMEFNFGGLVPLSTVDWRGRSSAVIFFNGCPFRCPYCHNFRNITASNPADSDEIMKKACASLGFVSALIFLGGEPTMQEKALTEMAAKAKEKKMAVGIHTNGYFPETIGKLIEKGLADKFFIDVKAPLRASAYSKTTGIPEDPEKPVNAEKAVSRIRRSLETVDESAAELEVRTTVFRGFSGSEEEIREIAETLKAIVKHPEKTTYVLQQGIGRNSNDPVLQKTPAFSPEEMTELGKAAADVLGGEIRVFIRTEENGQEEIPV